MRIGIDARFYGPEAKGLGRYSEKLIEYLQQLDSENEYIIFLRKKSELSFNPAKSNFKKVLADYRCYSLKEQLKFPGLIKKQKVDLMHFPHFNVPLFYRGKFIVTIHDLILTRFPTERASTLGPVLYWIKHTAYKIVIRNAVKRAKKIITVSKYSKKEIEDNFPFARGKVAVTYEATSDFKRTPSKVNEKNFFAKHNFSSPFLLYVGNAYPHKNLERLILAFDELKERNNKLYLVLVGKMDYFFRRLKKMTKELKLEKRVIFPGYLNDDELKFVYQKAALYVFPSLVEGFGLPPLEAMSQGLPVAASRASCLPEVLGPAAEYFDPYNPEEIERIIRGLLNDRKKLRILKERGFEQAKKYSWYDLAEKTLSLYKSIV